MVVYTVPHEMVGLGRMSDYRGFTALLTQSPRYARMHNTPLCKVKTDIVAVINSNKIYKTEQARNYTQLNLFNLTLCGQQNCVRLQRLLDYGVTLTITSEYG